MGPESDGWNVGSIIVQLDCSNIPKEHVIGHA